MRYKLMATAALALTFNGVAGPAPARATKAADALIRLDDLPDGYSKATGGASKAGCLNFENILKPGSQSTARARFENGSDSSVVHITGVYADITSADKAVAAVTKWAKDCAKFSFKIEGTKITEVISEMKFTPQTKADQMKAYRGSATWATFRNESVFVEYRQGTTVGVVIYGGWSADLDLVKTIVDDAISKA